MQIFCDICDICPYVFFVEGIDIMKEKTVAAMSWLQNQIDKAKSAGQVMTTIKLAPKGRLSEDTIAEAFRKARFEVQFGKDCVHVTPYNAVKTA